MRSILTSLFTVLREDPSFRFVWAETYFFSRWFAEQSESYQSAVREYVAEGRVEFVGGGAVQHDEALPSLDMMLRQTEDGMDFLYQQFGIRTLSVAWQIDPFGHSAITPELFASFGARFFVGNRIDKEVKEEMKRSKSLEFVWRGSSLGQQADVLSHILPYYYGFPAPISTTSYDGCWYSTHKDPQAW